MSISRRQFLLSTTVTGAGLVLPNTFDRLFDHLEKTGEPLLEKPKRQVAILNAVDGYDGFQLNLGDPFEEPGPITLREYLSDYLCMDFDKYLEDIEGWEGGPVQVSLEDEVPWEDWIDAWGFTKSPHAKAYRLLENLDLGAEFESPDPVGEIQFIDGPCPGSDYFAAHAANAVSLSLLQQRLNQLDTGIQIKVAREMP